MNKKGFEVMSKEIIFILVAIVLVTILVLFATDSFGSAGRTIDDFLCGVLECDKEVVEQLPGVYGTDIPEEILDYYQGFIKAAFDTRDINFDELPAQSGMLILYPKFPFETVNGRIDYKDYDRYVLETYPVKGEGLYIILRDTDLKDEYILARPYVAQYSYLKHKDTCVLPKSNEDGVYETHAKDVLSVLGHASNQADLLEVLGKSKVEKNMQFYLTEEEPLLVYPNHEEEFVDDNDVEYFMIYVYKNWTCFFPTVTKSWPSPNNRVHLDPDRWWTLEGRGFIYTNLISDVLTRKDSTTGEELKFKKVIT